MRKLDPQVVSSILSTAAYVLQSKARSLGRGDLVPVDAVDHPAMVEIVTRIVIMREDVATDVLDAVLGSHTRSPDWVSDHWR